MKKYSCKGFTLIELSLSIAFISILTITVALIIRDAISSYQRGLTLNKINTVGMELVDDMRAVIQGSSASNLQNMCATRLSGDAVGKCENDNAHNFILVSKTANVLKGNEDEMKDVPVFGAFCTGTYSYIWNSGYFFADGYEISESDGGLVGPASFTYNNGSESIDGFKLLKVQDKTFEVCAAATTGGNNEKYGEVIGSNFVATGNIFEDPEDLLAGGGKEQEERADNNLAIYDLYSGVPAVNANSSALFYSVSFILGTIQGGINIKTSGDFCKAPAEYDSNFDYCAINKFNFAAQAIGG